MHMVVVSACAVVAATTNVVFVGLVVWTGTAAVILTCFTVVVPLTLAITRNGVLRLGQEMHQGCTKHDAGSETGAYTENTDRLAQSEAQADAHNCHDKDKDACQQIAPRRQIAVPSHLFIFRSNTSETDRIYLSTNI